MSSHSFTFMEGKPLDEEKMPIECFFIARLAKASKTGRAIDKDVR